MSTAREKQSGKDDNVLFVFIVREHGEKVVPCYETFLYGFLRQVAADAKAVSAHVFKSDGEAIGNFQKKYKKGGLQVNYPPIKSAYGALFSDLAKKEAFDIGAGDKADRVFIVSDEMGYLANAITPKLKSLLEGAVAADGLVRVQKCDYLDGSIVEAVSGLPKSCDVSIPDGYSLISIKDSRAIDFKVHMGHFDALKTRHLLNSKYSDDEVIAHFAGVLKEYVVSGRFYQKGDFRAGSDQAFVDEISKVMLVSADGQQKTIPFDFLAAEAELLAKEDGLQTILENCQLGWRLEMLKIDRYRDAVNVDNLLDIMELLPENVQQSYLDARSPFLEQLNFLLDIDHKDLLQLYIHAYQADVAKPIWREYLDGALQKGDADFAIFLLNAATQDAADFEKALNSDGFLEKAFASEKWEPDSARAFLEHLYEVRSDLGRDKLDALFKQCPAGSPLVELRSGLETELRSSFSGSTVSVSHHSGAPNADATNDANLEFKNQSGMGKR